MGWCTHFRRTWRPGYGSDVIDPNKAFDFERRLIIIKKLVIIVLLLALLSAVIYFAVSSMTSKHEEHVTNSPIISQPQAPPEEQVRISSVVVSSLPSRIEQNITNNSVIVSSLTNTKEDNATGHNSSLATSLPPPAHHEIDNDSPVTSLPTLISNNTQKHNNSDLSCSTSGNAMECIALSKNFKSLTTFSNSTSKHNGSVEGYVMVKMDNNTWHPYCYPKWTLEMGHRLCSALGFQQFQRLQTIDIAELKQRINHRLGKDITLRSENPSSSSQLHELLVLTTESSVVPLRTNTSQFNCNAGYISCN